jgi:DNA-binding FadR family transcriptional regulator
MLKALYTVWLSNFIALHGNAKSDRFHHQIFEAIRAKDADKAREVMTEHLSDVLHKVRLDGARKPRALRAKKQLPDG